MHFISKHGIIPESRQIPSAEYNNVRRKLMKTVLTKVLSSALASLLLIAVVSCGDGRKNAPVSPSDLEKEARYYRSLLLSVDYGENTNYVIGHKTPDAATVGSAVAYADLLNRVGIKAQGAISGELNKETTYAYEKLCIKAPETVTNAEGKQLVCSGRSQQLFTGNRRYEQRQNCRHLGSPRHRRCHGQ